MDRSAYFHYADGSKFKGQKTKEIFHSIKSENYWEDQESASGPGSSLQQTQEIRIQLPILFEKLQVKSILDIPCGDFNWMKYIITKEVHYIGADIVKTLVEQNNLSFKSKNIAFKHLDLLIDRLGMHDVIFCRDCLVHLSYKDIDKALNNIKRSCSTYLISTTFPEEEFNKDIPTGGWRPIDLEKPPFNFQAPDFLINEKCTEGEGLFKDKSLGVWKIANLSSTGKL